MDIFNNISLIHFQCFFWPKFSRKKLFETQRVSVTWPKLLQLADQAKRGGSLTAMFFLHGYINDWWFWFHFCPIFKGKKCFCWCHTNTLGTILRRFPLEQLESESNQMVKDGAFLSKLNQHFELHKKTHSQKGRSPHIGTKRVSVTSAKTFFFP